MRKVDLHYSRYSESIFLICAAYIIISSSPSLSQVSEQPLDSLHIEQVVADVIHHNDRLAAARYKEQSVQFKSGPAGAWDDPMLMVGVVNLPTSLDFQMDDMTMKMISLSQNIPYSGYKALLAKAAKSEARASSAERQSIETDLATAAKLAFYDLYYKDQSLTELLRQKELLAQVASSTLDKLKANQVSQEEYLSAQSGLWRIESEILSAEQELDETRYSLNALRGIQVDKPLPPLAQASTIGIPDSVSPWLDAAYANYSELRKLQLQSESYEFSAAASKRMSWPMFTLSGNYGIREGIGMNGLRDNMIGFQAEISLPLFSGRQQRSMAHSMSAMSKSSLASASQLRRDSEAQINSLYWRAVRLSESLNLYRDRIVPTSEEAFKSALAGYAVNNTSFTALINSAISLHRDRIATNQIANELARTMTEVERYITDPEKLNPKKDNISK